MDKTCCFAKLSGSFTDDSIFVYLYAILLSSSKTLMIEAADTDKNYPVKTRIEILFRWGDGKKI